MAAVDKPYLLQYKMLHPDLQALLESEFHVVFPGGEAEEEGMREKVVAIFTWVAPVITRELMAPFPNLKVVGNCAVGYNHVDLQACAERGVRVGYTPDVLSKATADIAWTLLLASGRRLVEGNDIAKSPSTSAYDPSWFGLEVSGTTLGIIGMGRIGYEVARRAVGFDMKILYHNRQRRAKEEEERVGAVYVSTLSQLLSQSDYVVLAAPASSETRHMMGREQFSCMKKTAVFVNISRGSLVHQESLDEALRGGAIAAAGLDVTDPEPLPRDHKLLSAPNLTLAPHVGSATLPTRRAMLQMTIDNIKAVLQGTPMVNEVPLPSNLQ